MYYLYLFLTCLLFVCVICLCTSPHCLSVFLVSGIWCIINCVHLNGALHLNVTPAVLGFTHYLEKVVLQNHIHSLDASVWLTALTWRHETIENATVLSPTAGLKLWESLNRAQREGVCYCGRMSVFKLFSSTVVSFCNICLCLHIFFLHFSMQLQHMASDWCLFVLCIYFLSTYCNHVFLIFFFRSCDLWLHAALKYDSFVTVPNCFKIKCHSFYMRRCFC